MKVSEPTSTRLAHCPCLSIHTRRFDSSQVLDPANRPQVGLGAHWKRKCSKVRADAFRSGTCLAPVRQTRQKYRDDTRDHASWSAITSHRRSNLPLLNSAELVPQPAANGCCQVLPGPSAQIGILESCNHGLVAALAPLWAAMEEVTQILKRLVAGSKVRFPIHHGRDERLDRDTP